MIAIEPGRYRDRSIWSANHLTIMGTGAGVVITGPPCDQKALFITPGRQHYDPQRHFRLVDVLNGGALLIQDNVLEKGPRSGNPGAAVMIGEEGAILPTPRLVIDRNHFHDDQLRKTIFVHNFTATSAVLTQNILVSATLSRWRLRNGALNRGAVRTGFTSIR
ncbi:MAG: hypothetical protein JO081_09765 [Alphaproteobacteria bacterium]|nr:hypothetical protein [Alphaproteobacteria bacterium]